MSTLAISSICLLRALGPLHFDQRDDDGNLSERIYPFPAEYSLEDFVTLARTRLGVGAVEICQIQFDSSGPERIERLRAALMAANVSFAAMPIDVGDLGQENPDFLADDVVRTTKWFEIAASLGARFVRVNAGAPTTTVAPDRWKRLVGALDVLSDQAARLGMSLLIENHGGSSSEPDFLLGLRDEVGADRLGILLDLGNFDPIIGISHGRSAGVAPVDTGLDLEPVYAKIERLAPVASLVHVKAIDPASDGTPLTDVRRTLGIVAGSGYSGPLTVEWEGLHGDPWDRTAELVGITREIFPQLR